MTETNSRRISFMTLDDKLARVFADELRELMMISYIVLGNNAVTNRFIERTYQMPVHAWSSLYAIAKFPGIRAKEIRMIFPRPQNTISRAISLLESQGYVRQEASAVDGREKRVFATLAGIDILAEMTDCSRKRQAELFSPLSEAERQVFFDLAHKIAAGPHLLQSDVMGQDDS
jgi:DNA-binding MarR family transcriptional regulator